VAHVGAVVEKTAPPEFQENPRRRAVRLFVRRYARNRLAVVGLVLLVGLVFVAVFAPQLAPYSPYATDYGAAYAPPSADHPFGADAQGRDQLSRILFGAQYSMTAGLVSVAVGLGLGLVLGALAGYFGGWVDMVIMRVIDIVLAFPTFLLAVSFAFMLGAGLDKAILAVGIVSVPSYARIARGSVLQAKENDYVVAARAMGSTTGRVLWRHIVPNIFGPLLVRATLGTSEAILDVAGLSFLGLGAQLPTPEWGFMLSRSIDYFYQAPHLILFPGIAITLAVLAFNLVGDGLRDALDPRSSR
jgi:ABC-type dipeptide/oligopeptide/nickel transport system permease subunit